MTPTPPSKNKQISVKQIIIIFVVLAIACVGILTIAYFVDRSIDEEFSAQEMDEIMDEITRAKHFVSDWYLELNNGNHGNCSAYLNEIRFGNNEYSLTFAGERLRAVYPRGDRYFKLEYIDKVEFFEADGKARCRIYYGRDGEYTFTV